MPHHGQAHPRQGGRRGSTQRGQEVHNTPGCAWLSLACALLATCAHALAPVAAFVEAGAGYKLEASPKKGKGKGGAAAAEDSGEEADEGPDIWEPPRHVLESDSEEEDGSSGEEAEAGSDDEMMDFDGADEAEPPPQPPPAATKRRAEANPPKVAKPPAAKKGKAAHA